MGYTLVVQRNILLSNSPEIDPILSPRKKIGKMLFPHKAYRQKRLIGINELSEYLQVSKKTIYSWVWQKRIPYTKVGHLLRFDLRIIEQWIKENSVAAFGIVDTHLPIR